jgi:hypothetical protein
MEEAHDIVTEHSGQSLVPRLRKGRVQRWHGRFGTLSVT